jgi:hypothetical protein
MSEEPDPLPETFIEVGSGVSQSTRQGFCTIMIDGRGVGQMEPNEVRTMALHWLEAAEAAEMDAMVLAELTAADGLDLADETALGFIVALRARRELT